MTQVKKLLTIRDRIISDVKHHISVVLEFNEQTKPSLIKIRKSALTRTHEEFINNLRLLEGLPDSKGELTNDAEERQIENNALDDEYFTAIAILEELTIDEPSVEQSNPFTSTQASLPQFNSQIKLPPIKFTKFNGEFSNWEEFKDTFQACVTSKQGEREMSDCQKFLYLRGTLGEEPALLIKNLKATNANYPVAWSILNQRYDNQRKLVYAQYQTILDIPLISHETAESIRHLLDTANASMASIKTQTSDIGGLDEFIVYILSQKFDKESRKHWEEELKSSKDLPQFDKLKKFLETRYTVLDGLKTAPVNTSNFKREELPHGQEQEDKARNNKRRTQKAFFTKEQKIYPCGICSKDHRIYQCIDMKEASIPQRYDLIRQKGLCENCFGKHATATCTSKYVCLVCNQKHHTLLHSEDRAVEKIHHIKHAPIALLATAQVKIRSITGKFLILRALVDQGSSTNLITSKTAKVLSSTPINITTPLLSIGNVQTVQARQKITCTIGSTYSDYEYTTEALVIPKITEITHISSNLSKQWTHLTGLELADPQYQASGDIDMLLGVEVYSEILLKGLIKGPKHTPIAQKTKLGWILSGTTTEKTTNPPTCLFTKIDMNQLNSQIKRFWEVEELNNARPLFTLEETECERQFVATTTRGKDGRYIVRLPFKKSPKNSNFLGDTYSIALKRYVALERKLFSNPTLRAEYEEYIQGYIKAKHLRKATTEEINNTTNCYFMPHHAVCKKSSTSTKLRVVFDASCKSSNGYSLNDRLLVGPTIQPDLFTTILKWRHFSIAFTADITKMYRQFWVHPDDAQYQRILWRTDGIITQYLSHTITFGTASAPFQAIRLLHHIADETSTEFPHIASIIKNHFYLDDCVGGSDNITDAIQIYQDFNKVFEPRGLQLRKWASNSQKLLQVIPPDEQEKQSAVILPDEFNIKALGIQWNPSLDIFRYTLSLPEPNKTNTKRTYLSEFATLFDPLGWLSPSLILSKILLQHIWIKGIDWDEPLPKDINKRWRELRAQFQYFTQIKIPRWLGITSTNKHISLHCYADASERAMAAVIYVRIKHDDGQITSRLLTAKTRVAPIKKISIPRLELNAAHLLANLYNKIAPNFPDDTEIRAYTDSTITLCWIKSHPVKWKTYVANRITLIQEKIPAEKWYHIRSKNNPADCASRGIHPQELVNHSLWWHGPSYLLKERDKWPHSFHPTEPPDHEEQRKNNNIIFHIKPGELINDLLTSKSTLTKLLVSTSYCLRFLHRTGRNYGSQILTTSELANALTIWIKISQKHYFSKEYQALKGNNPISPNSKLIPLSPFLDKACALRIRGRLQNADIPYDQQSPIILPDRGHFTRLIIEDAHQRTRHGGAQLTLQYIRQHYWIINARNTVRHQLWKCVKCFRFKRATAQQLMGTLPSPRVNPCLPFLHAGVDFAGPFEVKTSSLRQSSYSKCYIALFICLATKAIHLELVEDLSTSAFIAAFQRFASRRGIPSHMYSDNGTNFVGASNELPRLLTNIMTQQSQEVAKRLAEDGTQWHFIPPHSPHFGGLWEAGVKSMKHHLRRVLGNERLRAPIFHTLLTQIEATLNSRPLCQITADPDDSNYLTPGHFLIGRSPLVVPTPDISQKPSNLLNHYQHGQKLVQQFWQLWSREYLHRLQIRPKWATVKTNISVGQLVILKEDNMPPGKWLLGRVIKHITGQDNLVRVVDIRCTFNKSSTTLRRPINKICVLPIEDNKVETQLNTKTQGEDID